VAVWLQAKVCDCRLGLQPRLFAGSEDSCAETAYASVVTLYK